MRHRGGLSAALITVRSTLAKSTISTKGKEEIMSADAACNIPICKNLVICGEHYRGDWMSISGALLGSLLRCRSAGN